MALMASRYNEQDMSQLDKVDPVEEAATVSHAVGGEQANLGDSRLCWNIGAPLAQPTAAARVERQADTRVPHAVACLAHAGELEEMMESRVYAPTAVVVADDYRGVLLRITNMDSHRGCAADDSLEISNLKPFSLTVSVTRNGAPFACVLQLCLVTDDDQAIPPFLTEEDRRFPLLLGPDKAPTEAPPVEVPDTGVAVVKLQLGLKALSSKVHDRRFKLLVALNVPPETLKESPNLTVFSPCFKGITRLRPTAEEKRRRPAHAPASEGGLEQQQQQLYMLARRLQQIEEDNADLRRRVMALEGNGVAAARGTKRPAED
ncbi:hypothetical protein EMIHUDRAFT_469980 [Emiliania huxleyi CCMP1516]|uniref:Uncharacterized protein n=2 Tax=Emiliania huxleyi TaxID=2903 RepID=A0A0D3J9T9_EMIH1|nr:hypothetical protein EMIHUDRAFT_469980 [Emiliania huxleyi CCMP1516]EOD20274.1 hypothetical protein EMIHUDRAFT_469980 [Emiliania huxleyi CCMP1516]|eukprot:XP_005772703.1 hypothetical protein EMIHUDRAFT_469980 [Emiliania huxleyi CCMP1516]